MYNKWSKDADKILTVNWPSKSKEELETIFNLPYAKIWNRANRLKILSSRPKYYKRMSRRIYPTVSDLSKLLSKSKEASYWIGYMLADGSISIPKSLRVWAGEKDRDHLEKFAKFIGTKVIIVPPASTTFGYTAPMCVVTASGKDSIVALIGYLGYVSNKTYNPPTKTVEMPMEEYLPMLIGFIDGDGNIYHTKSGYQQLTLELHSSWEPFLVDMVNRFRGLGYVAHYPKLTKRGYIRFSTGSTKLIEFLREASKSVPSLERKWS